MSKIYSHKGKKKAFSTNLEVDEFCNSNYLHLIDAALTNFSLNFLKISYMTHKNQAPYP